MAIDYEWTWGPMRVEKVEEFSDAVTGIYFVCIAKDTDQNFEVHGKISDVFALPPVDPKQYIPLSDLTDEMIQNWITNYFDKSEWEKIAQENLNQQLNPEVKVVPMP